MSKQKVFVDFVNCHLVGKKCIFVATPRSLGIQLLIKVPDIRETVIIGAILTEDGNVQIQDSEGITLKTKECFVDFTEFLIHIVVTYCGEVFSYTWKLTREEVRNDKERNLFVEFIKANKEMRNEQ